jgi:hypothetical protein
MADLLDPEDGENRAVRSFLACYGGACGVTVIQMRDHMRRSGFPFWPDWVEPMGREHLTKGGAQQWLRHLFALEAQGTAEANQPSKGE